MVHFDVRIALRDREMTFALLFKDGNSRLLNKHSALYLSPMKHAVIALFPMLRSF
jgi:hypothetical protein